MKNCCEFETRHSVERAKERLGINERQAGRKFKLAVSRGKTSESFKGAQQEYLSNHSSDTATAVAYDGCCYIIGNNNRCITVYELPRWFNKGITYDGKQKVKNVKKYAKLNPHMWEEVA